MADNKKEPDICAMLKNCIYKQYLRANADNLKLRIALDEIEEAVNKGLKQRIINKTKTTTTVETINKIDYKKILDIIKEAKEQ